jgi:tRNA 2-selenouridine synthase SelU
MEIETDSGSDYGQQHSPEALDLPGTVCIDLLGDTVEAFKVMTEIESELRLLNELSDLQTKLKEDQQRWINSIHLLKQAYCALRRLRRALDAYIDVYISTEHQRIAEWEMEHRCTPENDRSGWI